MLVRSPFALGEPQVFGVIRQHFSDFIVEENLGFEPMPDPQGEHLWLWIRNTDQNTAWVAGELAKAAGLHPSKASFAGLKDRHAITTQWISLYLGARDTPDVSQWQIEGVEVLKTVRCQKKLQRGRLAGNRFELTLRALSPNNAPGLDIQVDLNQRLAQIQHHGVPNYFGEQRFGEDNLGRARRLFAGELRGQRAKAKQGFYLSAARSFLFNEVLAQRVALGHWNEFLPGDVAQLDGSQSFFKLKLGEEHDPAFVARLKRFDVHPTGPLPGLEPSPVSDEVARLEAEVLGFHPDLVQGLAEFKVKTLRRSLRSVVDELTWTWLDEDSLRLEFGLSSGAFATAVVRELIAYEP